MEFNSCSFFGFLPDRDRFCNNEEDSDYIELKLALLQEIKILYQNGVTRFLTGCKPGIDIWAAEIVVSLMERYSNIELICIISSEERELHRSHRLCERYSTILNNSTSTILLNTQFTEDFYETQTRYLIAHADILLTIDNPEWRNKSIIGQMVTDAHQKGKVIIYIHPVTAYSNSL